MDSKTKVGFIGFGNMGSAICDGLIKEIGRAHV